MKTSMFYLYMRDSDTNEDGEAFRKMNLVFRLPGIGDDWHLNEISIWEYSGDPAEFVFKRARHGVFIVPPGSFPIKFLQRQFTSLDDARLCIVSILACWLDSANHNLFTDETCAYLEELVSRFGESIMEFCGKWYGGVKRELDIFDIGQSVRGRHRLAAAANQ